MKKNWRDIDELLKDENKHLFEDNLLLKTKHGAHYVGQAFLNEGESLKFYSAETGNQIWHVENFKEIN